MQQMLDAVGLGAMGDRPPLQLSGSQPQRAAGASLVLVTHSPDAAARADRVVRLTATGIAPSTFAHGPMLNRVS